MPEDRNGPETHPLLKYIVNNPDAFAHNVAAMIEAAGKATAAYVEPREKGEAKAVMTEEITTVVKTLAQVGDWWMRDPARMMEAQSRLAGGFMDLWGNSLRRAMGEDAPDTAVPAPGDKRFADAEWRENRFFDFLKQAYLLTSRWAEQMVDEADDLDPHTRHKADFYVRQLTAALSPSNFVLTNPELLRETLTSNGENLVRGLEMMAEDIQAGGGDLKIRQSDTTKFKVGENLALTPGSVIYENEICQIIQYAATTEKVAKRPLLIVPPWINKYYVLDLTPEKSLIKWLVDQGRTVFVISWVNPDERHAGKSFEHYMQEGVLTGVDVACKVTRSKEVDTVGYCVGGTLLAVTLAWCAAKGDERIASATFFTTQVDFTNAGDLKVFVDEDQIRILEDAMAQKGYLDGSKMAAAFNALRANDLIWPYFVNNYMRGKDPFPFDLLYWNSDSTRMPAANHSFYLRNCYLENNLARGEMVVAGERLDLSKVTVPVYNLATREDHIAPADSVFVGSRLFGGPVKYVVSGSGHIAGVVNHPSRNKYQYWTGGPPEGAYKDWLDKATETPGSWWPDWDAWLRAHDPREVKARRIGGGRYNVIEDAPGSYVRKRV
ncbi:class I poly(R)-hydroxyalkanoic acid synthase [Methylobrevis pamukkalensis]|uniref:Class I poly(R)-hydroxyalkanoic acid synthase n=1 Tax=Methylobrevis pamukkalensis TaxID=1439726 RepID=A0A1E3H0H1_9HYPH|nr:class I poly(R)-hydroxyalkanoic acid synthase [Methylobrevis pamukkalensis]ODN69809.1 class I poly(R)-hydroxyalkanoic acid synthase [Methylobrevis pamukkalensis]